MKQLFIIKVGTTYPNIKERFGDFDQWTSTVLGKTNSKVIVVDAEHGEALPMPEDCKGVIVTGSHAMVTDREDWSDQMEQWIRTLIRSKVPYFGICYGHQLLASAMGGIVGYHAKGDEIGTANIRLTKESHSDPLFRKIPEYFLANVYHSQTVLSLPEGAVCLAFSSHESHHGFRVGASAWGVQFHPEFSTEILRSYVLENEPSLIQRGFDVSSILEDIADTPIARTVIRRFVEYAESSC